MKTFTKLAVLAAFALGSAGAYAAASNTTVFTGKVDQTQSGSRNKQDLAVGVNKTSTLGVSNLNVFTGAIKQTQSGSRNKQSLKIGELNGGLGLHTATVATGAVTQTQSGSRNKQSMKIGVVE